MPLSEDEQRVLRDIERNFYENDPAFAEAVGKAVLYRHAKRNAKLATVGFIASLALLLLTFTQAPLLGFIGFLGMVASAFVVVQNVRHVGSDAMRQQPAPVEGGQNAGPTINEIRDRLRRRFGQP